MNSIVPSRVMMPVMISSLVVASSILMLRHARTRWAMVVWEVWSSVSAVVNIDSVVSISILSKLSLIYPIPWVVVINWLFSKFFLILIFLLSNNLAPVEIPFLEEVLILVWSVVEVYREIHGWSVSIFKNFLLEYLLLVKVDILSFIINISLITLLYVYRLSLDMIVIIKYFLLLIMILRLSSDSLNKMSLILFMINSLFIIPVFRRIYFNYLIFISLVKEIVLLLKVLSLSKLNIAFPFNSPRLYIRAINSSHLWLLDPRILFESLHLLEAPSMLHLISSLNSFLFESLRHQPISLFELVKNEMFLSMMLQVSWNWWIFHIVSILNIVIMLIETSHLLL